MSFDPAAAPASDDERMANAGVRMAQIQEELVAWIKTLFSAAVYAILIVTFGFQVARVEGLSMHLVERFSLDDANTLRYQFTVEDLATWTKPWTASIPMARTDDQIFEYACHEANYGLENVLKGGRYRDQAGSTK